MVRIALGNDSAGGDHRDLDLSYVSNRGIRRYPVKYGHRILGNAFLAFHLLDQ